MSIGLFGAFLRGRPFGFFRGSSIGIDVRSSATLTLTASGGITSSEINASSISTCCSTILLPTAWPMRSKLACEYGSVPSEADARSASRDGPRASRFAIAAAVPGSHSSSTAPERSVTVFTVLALRAPSRRKRPRETGTGPTRVLYSAASTSTTRVYGTPSMRMRSAFTSSAPSETPCASRSIAAASAATVASCAR
jgi:hypothetical protein